MKNRIITAATLIVLGFLIAIGPRTIFEVCESMGGDHMTCHWTAQAELGVGVVIAVLGLLHLVFKSLEIRAGLSIATLLNGVFALLIPTWLIGVCGMPSMSCHAVTRPALLVISILVIIVSVANAIYLLSKSVRRSNANEKEPS